METQYLDSVNKELQDIERFFQELYNSHPSNPPAAYASSLLPLLKFGSCKPSPRSSNAPSTNSFIRSAVDDTDEDYAVADLRARYRQLKAVQDQLHIELTRSRIWEWNRQHEQERKPRCSGAFAASNEQVVFVKDAQTNISE
ncbi:hypothetical protein BGZ54_009696, partial [Gamsiella multidivaricata]